MQKWEYLRIQQEATYPKFKLVWEPAIDLERLGDNGWELVIALPKHWHGETATQVDTVVWIFKRPKNDADVSKP